MEITTKEELIAFLQDVDGRVNNLQTSFEEMNTVEDEVVEDVAEDVAEEDTPDDEVTEDELDEIEKMFND